MRREWPSHFGEGCPPVEADDLDRKIFYLVSQCPPVARDFQSAIERGAFDQGPPCLRAGLSCAVEGGSLLKLQQRVPRLRRYRLASAELTAEHGKYQQTTDRLDHYTMWLRARALKSAPDLFSCEGSGS